MRISKKIDPFCSQALQSSWLSTSGPALIGVKVDGKVINALLDFHLGGTTSKFLSGFSTPAAIVVRQRAQPPEKIKHVWFRWHYAKINFQNDQLIW